jgi:thioredoxin reductase (NADPH)
MTHPIHETDAVVIGAGPVGLWQVFQLGLQGIRAHLIDALPHAGGQCVELYGDKPIYDIPGVPVCTGRELAALLLRQIEPFDTIWHLEQRVASLVREPDGRHRVTTSHGTTLLTQCVFIAAGVGAFVPRTLKLEGVEPLVGQQVFYQRLPRRESWSGQHVVIHGGDDAAIACVLALGQFAPAQAPASITLLHRRDVFQGPADQLATLQKLRDTGRVRVKIAQITGLELAQERLVALQCVDAQGATQREPVDTLVPALGISPRLGPIADWGLAMDRKQLVVDTQAFRTPVPGIYAVGDIVTYPGKRKLLLCGFHEATLAALDAAEQLSGAPVPTQYTTTSTRLLQRLGVTPSTD